MSYIDLIIGAVLAFNVFQGIRRGLILIVMDSLGIVGSIMIAVNLYPELSQYFQMQFQLSNKVADILSFIGFWVVFFFLITTFGRLLNTVFSGSIFGPLNWLGGAFVGLIRGVFFISLLIIPLFILDVKVENNSFILNSVKPYAKSVINGYISIDKSDS